MKTRRITVWDYNGVSIGKGHNGPALEQPIKFEVDAWCLAGETGFIVPCQVPFMPPRPP